MEKQEKVINPAQQVHGQEEVDAIMRVAESGHWAEGQEAETFRQALKEYLGVRYVTLVNSGSSANLAALLSLTTEYVPDERRIYPGDEVITTALCFPTTVAPIKYAGAVPVFVDVDETWNIDVEQVRSVISEKTKAIMVAHNLGNPFNLEEIMKICEEFGLTLIEDNCDALSSEWCGRKTGTLGHIGTSSFYPAHHISTGEGGAVYTNNPHIYRGIRSMVNWGRDCYCEPGQDNTCNKRYCQQHGDLPFGYDHKNTYTELGFNLKMTDFQAAIGVEQLKRLPQFAEARRHNHAYLLEYFSKWQDYFDLPQHYPEANPSWFGYVIKLKPEAPFKRDDMVKFLDSYSIRSRAFFCGNITKQPAIYGRDDLDYRTSDSLTKSDEIMETAFWIGVHPALTDEDRRYITDVIDAFITEVRNTTEQ